MFHYDGKIGSVAVWGGVLYWRRRFGEDKSYEVIPDSNLSIYEQAEQVLAMPITDRNGEPVKECGSLEDLVNNPYFKGIYTIV